MSDTTTRLVLETEDFVAFHQAADDAHWWVVLPKDASDTRVWTISAGRHGVRVFHLDLQLVAEEVEDLLLHSPLAALLITTAEGCQHRWPAAAPTGEA